MIDLQDKNHCPTLTELEEYVKNPVFMQFCSGIKEKYECSEKIEFSGCSMERGWNIKFKKSGRTLCTLYPRESYFTAMVVVSQKEKEDVEALLPECTQQLREIYTQTKEGNGQRWLMIDIEDAGDLYRDVLRLVDVRKKQGYVR